MTHCAPNPGSHHIPIALSSVASYVLETLEPDRMDTWEQKVDALVPGRPLP